METLANKLVDWSKGWIIFFIIWGLLNFISGVVTIFQIGLMIQPFVGGIVFLALAAYLYVHNHGVVKTKLAKSVAKYHETEDTTKIENELTNFSRELARPKFEMKKFIVTNNWVMGKTNIIGTPVAMPLNCVAGVYFYHLIKHTSKGRREFFQILINDRFDGSLILRVNSLSQLEQAYDNLVKACPWAMKGNYLEDYIEDYCTKSKEERSAILAEIYRNATA